MAHETSPEARQPSMKCYRKNGSDAVLRGAAVGALPPSMKCYRKNGSDDLALRARHDLQGPQ